MKSKQKLIYSCPLLKSIYFLNDNEVDFFLKSTIAIIWLLPKSKRKKKIYVLHFVCHRVWREQLVQEDSMQERKRSSGLILHRALFPSVFVFSHRTAFYIRYLHHEESLFITVSPWTHSANCNKHWEPIINQYQISGFSAFMDLFNRFKVFYLRCLNLMRAISLDYNFKFKRKKKREVGKGI